MSRYRRKLNLIVLFCGSSIVVSGCVEKPRLSDNQLIIDSTFGGREFSPEEKERLKAIYARKQEKKLLQNQEVAANPSLSRTRSTEVEVSEFPSAPPDRKSDCDDADSEFVRWINRVQSTASSGGACLNAKGAYLINSEGAKKSRYCAQFYMGAERAQSFQQAEEYDRIARQAQNTVAESCS